MGGKSTQTGDLEPAWADHRWQQVGGPVAGAVAAMAKVARRPVTAVDRQRAACLGVTDDTFFAPDTWHQLRAKAICSICEVRLPCLTYALATRQRLGVWGGLSPSERMAVERRIRSAGFQPRADG